jgi:hypothetical protein
MLREKSRISVKIRIHAKVIVSCRGARLYWYRGVSASSLALRMCLFAMRVSLEEGIGGLYRREQRDDGGEENNGTHGSRRREGRPVWILKTIGLGLTQTRYYLRRDRP